MEPATGLAILGTAIGSAKIVEKILGPTADYIGEGIKIFTKRRVKNVSRIFSKANTFLGDKLESPGAVPPKILKTILDDGSFCDDELTSEYFGGVLASSRTGISRDDRAITYLNLTTNLSTYQLRFHYIFYATIKRIFTGLKIQTGETRDLVKMWLYFPYEIFSKAMDLQPDEDLEGILVHIISGLVREDLITLICYGDADYINNLINSPLQKVTTIQSSGIVVEPTCFGIEYYLWAHGRGDITHHVFLDSEVDIPTSTILSVPSGVIPIKKNP